MEAGQGRRGVAHRVDKVAHLVTLEVVGKTTTTSSMEPVLQGGSLAKKVALLLAAALLAEPEAARGPQGLGEMAGKVLLLGMVVHQVASEASVARAQAGLRQAGALRAVDLAARRQYRAAVGPRKVVMVVPLVG